MIPITGASKPIVIMETEIIKGSTNIETMFSVFLDVKDQLWGILLNKKRLMVKQIKLNNTNNSKSTSEVNYRYFNVKDQG